MRRFTNTSDTYSEYFVPGLNYVCMKSTLHKEMHKNCVYELVCVEGARCKMRDILSGAEYDIKTDKLVKENLTPLPFVRARVT